MPIRIVTHSRKNQDGDILALCNPGQDWSPRRKNDAINDIGSRLHDYYVNVQGEGRVRILVVPNPTTGRRHLRTHRDGRRRNNLDSLPNC